MLGKILHGRYYEEEELCRHHRNFKFQPQWSGGSISILQCQGFLGKKLVFFALVFSIGGGWLYFLGFGRKYNNLHITDTQDNYIVKGERTTGHKVRTVCSQCCL